MRKPNYWLKPVSATDHLLADRWIETNPELLHEVRCRYRPSGIESGDLLVYYAAGAQRVFAIARATEKGEGCIEAPKEGKERWPWPLRVQVWLAIPTLKQSPHWGVLEIESSSIQQADHIRINREEYRRAWEAIVERTKPEPR